MTDKEKLTVVIKKLASKFRKEARASLSTGGCQSSQEQWSKETTKDSKWEEITNVLYKLGSLIVRAKGHVAWELQRKLEKRRGPPGNDRRTANARTQR